MRGKKINDKRKRKNITFLEALPVSERRKEEVKT